MKATSLLAVLALVGTTAACQNQANRPGAATITQGEAPAEGGEAAPAAPAAAAGDGYRNTSTTLGDGTSGMYTGGQGTYGGRATWGTGGGAAPAAPAAEPAPAEPAAPAAD